MILELCKGVHCVDLDESFQTHIYLQNLASIQPRTSPVKFAHLAEKSGKSLKVRYRTFQLRSSPRFVEEPKTIKEDAAPANVHAPVIEHAEQVAGRHGRRSLLAFRASKIGKLNFARKYAFDSISQALQDLHTFAPLQSQNFRKKSVCKISNFRENSKFSKTFANVVCQISKMSAR